MSLPTASNWQIIIEKEQPQGVQTDLFGNIIESTETSDSLSSKSAVKWKMTPETSNIWYDKNINNTPHKYEAVRR